MSDRILNFFSYIVQPPYEKIYTVMLALTYKVRRSEESSYFQRLRRLLHIRNRSHISKNLRTSISEYDFLTKKLKM